jgi:hypothetical protein
MVTIKYCFGALHEKVLQISVYHFSNQTNCKRFLKLNLFLILYQRYKFVHERKFTIRITVYGYLL